MNTVILCARNTSTRLPGKATVSLCGKPMLQHLIERYRQCRRVDTIIVATPFGENEISRLCEMLDVPHYEGSTDDVVTRMDEALSTYTPDARYIFRGLGDMPLFEPELLDWRFELLERRGADVVWCGLPDDPLPVYGTRESPWSRSAWDEVVKWSRGDEREHAGLYLYRNLQRFNVIYTEALLGEYYAPVRLELDTPLDLALFEHVYSKFGASSRTLDVLRWLTSNGGSVAAINAGVELKTLTDVNWKRRGAEWRCEQCGNAHMIADYVRRGKLLTHCANCGTVRPFAYQRDPRRRGVDF